MRLEDGYNLIMDGLSNFHGNFKKMFGQIALRVNEDQYLTTGDTKVLSNIPSDDILLCDINSGDLGEILRSNDNINVLIFACTKDIVEASKSGDFFAPALDDLAYITGTSLGIIDNASPAKVIQGIRNSGVCLVRGIGAFVASDNMRAATTAALVIEKSCEAYVAGKLIGGSKPIDLATARALRSNYKNDYLTTNTDEISYIEYSEEETEMRSKLASFTTALANDDLIYGSWGNISVRYGEEDMLVTPSAMDYDDILYRDIVRMNLATLQTEDPRVPSMDAPLHAEMFKRLPDCKAIIHTHSNGCSVFAACEAGFVIPDPAMHQLIGDVKVIPYYTDQKMLADSVIKTMSDTHAAILAHHGAIFYGPSLEAVYEIASGVEKLAQALVFTEEE